MYDHLFFHSKNNVSNVHQLIKEKGLLPAEYANYQAYAKKNGRGHINLQGGMQLAKFKFEKS